jgi:hypothetical protein
MITQSVSNAVSPINFPSVDAPASTQNNLETPLLELKQVDAPVSQVKVMTTRQKIQYLFVTHKEFREGVFSALLLMMLVNLPAGLLFAFLTYLYLRPKSEVPSSVEMAPQHSLAYANAALV